MALSNEIAQQIRDLIKDTDALYNDTSAQIGGRMPRNTETLLGFTMALDLLGYDDEEKIEIVNKAGAVTRELMDFNDMEANNG